MPKEDKSKSLEIIKEFETNSLPLMRANLKQSYIHGDLNDQNLVTDKEGFVIGIIDFDDIAWSYPIVDLATTMMYIAIGVERDQMLDRLNLFYKSYVSIREVTQLERSLLYNLVLMRFVQSGAVSLYQIKHVDPENEYILTQHPSSKCFEIINFLTGIGEQEFMKKVFC